MNDNPVKTIIGFDPSLRNWGYCIANYNENTQVLEFTKGGVIHSKPDKEQRQNLQDLQSATQLYHGLHNLIGLYQPNFLVAELPVGSQSSRAMVSYATCISLSAALAYQDGEHTIPLLSITPQQVKATVGKKDASKDEVMSWVSEYYPEVDDWLLQFPKGEREHICDAIVATHTAIFN
ncbi:crossover junction endodeoxyribonuclease RuvC [Moraxella marmotae]|uniref:crossover junction endodeoxyribonuclease RuvC n=1 Tax=Moraxella marmotae TaxID=3344520 RepID=UPI0035F36386